jgi:hypothetical protein
MKTLNFKVTNDIFSKFALTNLEMIKVRGGENAEPTIKANIPPVKI